MRSVVGIALGLVAWFAVATVGNLILRAGLSGYAQVESAMNFTAAMLWARLLLGVLASFAAGFVVARIVARRRRDVLIAAALLLALFVPVHYSLWARFPAWYHVAFLVSLFVATVVGGNARSPARAA
jgi:uncharacterized membrane protein YhaH (DUF805 family)